MESVILSLDPGSSKIGWAITTFKGDIVSFGLISPANDSNKNIPFNKRMNLIIKSLLVYFEELLSDTSKNITHVAWEIVPSFGAMAQRELVQASAITLKVLTFQKDLPYAQFTPRDWHKKFSGKSSCTKDEVRELILERNLIRAEDNQLPIDAPYDVYDAIAIGLTAGIHGRWIIDELL